LWVEEGQVGCRLTRDVAVGAEGWIERVWVGEARHNHFRE